MAEIDPYVPLDVRIEAQGGKGAVTLKHPVFVRPQATFHEARLQIVIQNVWKDPFVFLIQKEGKTSVLNTAQEALFKASRGGLLLRAGEIPSPGTGDCGGGGGGKPAEKAGGKQKGGGGGGAGKDSKEGKSGKEQEGGKKEGGSDGGDGGGGKADGGKAAAGVNEAGNEGGKGNHNAKSQKGSKSPPRAAAADSKCWLDHPCHTLCKCYCAHPRTAIICSDPLRYWEIIADSLRQKLRQENRADRFHIIVGHEGGEEIVKVYCDECGTERSVGPGQTLCGFYTNHLRSRNHWERQLLNKMRA